jgi:FdhD protein
MPDAEAPAEQARSQPELVTRVAITRIQAGQASSETDAVVRETTLALLVGGRMVCRMQCSPDQLEELALGFLWGAGLQPADPRTVAIRRQDTEGETQLDVALGCLPQDAARLQQGLTVGTGCGLGLFSVKGFDPLDCSRKIDLSLRIAAADLTEAMRTFQKHSAVYRQTGGAHSAAMARGADLVVFAEDIGRHNAVDKVIGACLRRGVPRHDKLLLSTGRLSLDLVVKGIRAGVPLLASRSAPTAAAVELAQLANLTLVGFVRGDRMNVYAAEWRMT